MVNSFSRHITHNTRALIVVFALMGLPSSLETSFVFAQALSPISHTRGVGDLGTRMTIEGHTFQITGGTRAGSNLFHSFENFNVPNNNIANFLNDSGIATSNILGRVTGGNVSSILGTIQTTGFGNANLFLMNPAGIVFGPDAALNVSGSVSFTTADYLRFADTTGSNPGIFHADTTLPNILTNSPVAAFGFLGSNPSAIAVQGSMLTLKSGQSISLVGGDQGFSYTTLDTGTHASVPGGVTISGGSLSVKDGLVHLASVASPGEVLARTLNLSPNINGQKFVTLGEIEISEQSSINSSSGDGSTIIIRGGHLILKNESMISADTGDISLHTTHKIDIDASLVGVDPNNPPAHAGNITFRSDLGNISVTNSFISTQTLDSSGSTGSITISAPHGDIHIGDSSQLFTSNNVVAQGAGTLGDIHIIAHNLSLDGISKLGTDNAGEQRGGNISIALDGRLTIVGGSFINTGAFGKATSGDLNIQAPDIQLTGKDSQIYTGTITSGNGGHLNLHTDTLQLLNGGKLSGGSSIGFTGTVPSGSGGVITVAGINNPGTAVLIDGTESGIFTNAQNALGSAGTINVLASSLTATNGGALSVTTSGINPSAKGGSINVIATDKIILSNGASITASTSGPGNAGNVWVGANDISISGGSTITASSTGSGNAGTVTVQGLQSPVSSFLIDGSNSGVFTKTTNAGTGGNLSVSSNSIVIQNKGTVSGETSGTGSGGNIALTAGQSVTIKDGAAVSSSSIGPGVAGNIEINAGKQLDVERGSITTQSNQLNGGNINIQAIDLVRVVDGKVSTSVLGGAGSGGNITIDPKVVLLQNSDILAQANRGTGGDISITTPVFIADESSRVDASTPFGLNGRITIQSPTSNLSGTVGQLVSKTSPLQVLLQNRCVALAGGEQSTFLLAGRDALPGEPSGWLSSPISMEHWTGEDTAHASRLMARNQNVDSSLVIAAHSDKSRVLSLRRLTPPGFLVRTFATGATGCPS